MLLEFTPNVMQPGEFAGIAIRVVPVRPGGELVQPNLSQRDVQEGGVNPSTDVAEQAHRGWLAGRRWVAADVGKEGERVDFAVGPLHELCEIP